MSGKAQNEHIASGFPARADIGADLPERQRSANSGCEQPQQSDPLWLGGIGLANLLEQFEVRRLPSHHALLLVCRQVCAHPVDVEVQPRAAFTDRFHLVVSLQHQADFGNFHLLRIARALFGEIAEDGGVDQLQPVGTRSCAAC